MSISTPPKISKYRGIYSFMEEGLEFLPHRPSYREYAKYATIIPAVYMEVWPEN
jgi:pyoverdine/dityrosine biosynthesis protein Dit1